MTKPFRLYGAVGILNKRLLIEIIVDTACYILPSSVHEIIFFPANDVIDQKNLDRKVAQVNREVLDIEDVLTDHSYYYDCGAINRILKMNWNSLRQKNQLRIIDLLTSFMEVPDGQTWFIDVIQNILIEVFSSIAEQGA